MNQAITAALEAMLASTTPGLDRGGQGMPQQKITSNFFNKSITMMTQANPTG